MAVNHRKSRVADGVRDEVAMIIAREIRDPRLGFVTVIRVEMPVDQSVAKIYVSPMGDAKTQLESMRALHHSRGFVRKLLSQRMRTRTVPEIMFVQDKGLDNAERVGEIMAGWKAEEAEAAAVAAAQERVDVEKPADTEEPDDADAPTQKAD
ncbi:MAG: 30S ribosome-binding factor RbfA [Vicinamibacteria bacterium]|jgi:ribosome-binding factor A|nr:30S ribosome-binding factor RbfA [Vicinamibacteria bacterium]MBP9945604.1 30S ribosome-binding factor RbfA [Vicinamibacteria bacterium]